MSSHLAVLGYIARGTAFAGACGQDVSLPRTLSLSPESLTTRLIPHSICRELDGWTCLLVCVGLAWLAGDGDCTCPCLCHTNTSASHAVVPTLPSCSSLFLCTHVECAVPTHKPGSTGRLSPSTVCFLLFLPLSSLFVPQPVSASISVTSLSFLRVHPSAGAF